MGRASHAARIAASAAWLRARRSISWPAMAAQLGRERVGHRTDGIVFRDPRGGRLGGADLGTAGLQARS
jgi:hypothetical protein